MTPDMDVTADMDVPPTAPGRLPLVGHVVPLLKDRLEFVERLRTYGPIVRMSVGLKKVTVVNSHELIHEMLTSKSGSFSKGLLGEKLKLFGQSALPVAEGEPHLRRRRLLQPAFHRERISGYVNTMRETVEPSITGWREGELLDLKTEMGLMAQDVAMSVLCSFRAEQLRARAILDAVDTVFTAAIWRTMVPVSSLERLPTRSNRRLKAARSLLRSEVADIIAERRAAPDAHDDLVTLLLEARDETGAPLPDNEILSEIIGLLAAGSETTGVMLAWLFHELGRDPELERRLHEEVDSVVGEGPITAEHVPQLAFTRRLVSETLRLHHAGWLVTRQATKPVRLGQVVLPAGEQVLWSPYALHRDPALYPDPLRFDPDRWLPERPQPPRGAFIPFGSGKRMCIGDAFAWTEAIVITAFIASRWRLRPVPGATVEPVGLLTVHPSDPRMVAETRQRAVVGTAV
ncbi:cytochrome P450 [Streptomyces atratus]|uniref:cytochrome P450 n=1 Tax=Streptomyces atratus TaxID=1893 RepID=UPI0016715584|nr:cytochrome P450 [Streptomyces atratus]